MASIRPFAGLRFSPAAGDIGDLVAPPYDVISERERVSLAERSPYNTVWLTLPEECAGDRSKFIKYARSAARISEWRHDGKIATDSPGYYRYVQRFTNPATGKRLARESIICLLKTEPYERGVILPHEQTFPKHKEDRLRLLEATRTHLECIYGLYEDVSGGVADAIRAQSFEPVLCVQTEDGIEHELFHSSFTPEGSDAIASALSSERIWIADGHHRYETALNFRKTLGERAELIPEDYMMIALSGMHDPGLVLLPTHRIVDGVDFSNDVVEQRLQTYFHTAWLPNGELEAEISRLHSENSRVFGVALPGGRGVLATLADATEALNLVGGGASPKLKMLDVSILHDVILAKVFDIHGTDRVRYTRDADEALAAVETGSDTVAIFTNPPSVEDMRQIALGGEKMPQKSTFYYPKLLSGLVFWALEDFK
jgi:uncharacterized protein (DUF1015 family)